MSITPRTAAPGWQTKPSDRFILRWIKLHLSARITPYLLTWSGLEPWMITLISSSLGVLGGVVFALGSGWLAGCVAACAQILDGVDGQFARVTGKQSKGGAFWDSVLDRYADGAMVIGLIIYLARLPFPLPLWMILLFGALAIMGSNLISYSSARAESLGIDLGKPTLASKGTRTSVMILCAWGSLIWPKLPILALLYLAIHPNVVIVCRLVRASEVSQPLWPYSVRSPQKSHMTEMGVVHGRFQVFHNDHLAYVLASKSRCRHIVVGITNPDPLLTKADPTDPGRSDPGSNPLTYYERYVMVREVLVAAGVDYRDFSIVPLPINLPELYRYYVPLDATFYLTIYDEWGKRKLDLLHSVGLKTEVLWTRSLDEKGLRAGEIRRRMAYGEAWEHMVPHETAQLMKSWSIPDRIRNFNVILPPEQG